MDAESNVTQTQPKERKPFKKPVGAYSKPTKDAIALATTYDIPPKEAYQIVTGKTPHPETLKNVEKAVEKWSLRHPAALKSASKTIRAFAAGQSVGGVLDPETGKLVGEIKPKDSTVLAAAQRVLDQVDPVVRKSENVNVNIEIDPVDLSQFRRRVIEVNAETG